MKKHAFGVLAIVLGLGANAAEPSLKVSVLDNSVLFVRASSVPENVKDQIRAATQPGHLAGTVLDLRFADGASANATDYFAHGKSPLIILVNAETRGDAAALAAKLRGAGSAILIGSTNSSGNLSPDIVVSESPEDEKQFQENPFFNAAAGPATGMPNTNLLAFVDHTSEADLVRKRIKDGEDDGSVTTPRTEPAQPVIRDPALARAMDLLKALAALHSAHG